MSKLMNALLPSKRQAELGGNGGCGGMVSLIAVCVLGYGLWSLLS